MRRRSFKKGPANNTHSMNYSPGQTRRILSRLKNREIIFAHYEPTISIIGELEPLSALNGQNTFLDPFPVDNPMNYSCRIQVRVRIFEKIKIMIVNLMIVNNDRNYEL